MTGRRLDQPSGAGYKDKVSTNQILHANALQRTQELEEEGGGKAMLVGGAGARQLGPLWILSLELTSSRVKSAF